MALLKKGKKMSRVGDALLDLLFPPRCVCCTMLLASGEQDLCAACRRGIPRLTGEEAEQKREFISRVVSPVRYEGDVRKSIHRFKFTGRRGYAAVYGRWVAECVSQHLDGQYDLITWVPVSRKRRRERGYDQALLLARAAAQVLGTEVVETLRKERNNPAQSGITDESARRANVLGVYESVAPQCVDGKRVLILDDIITTGATLSECARVLRTAGAVDVVCATVARAH